MRDWRTAFICTACAIAATGLVLLTLRLIGIL